MQPLPNQSSPLVRLPNGTIIPPWNSYLQQFTQAPPSFVRVTVGASIFSYVAKEPGFIIVKGGTVSAIHLIRGTTSIDMTGQVSIPVSIQDKVSVTYSVVPTMYFIPIYGANT